MKNNKYYLENNIEKLLNNTATEFLMPQEYLNIMSKFKNCKIYKPFKDADKVILYTKEIPKITLFRIECNNILRHQDIMGAIFNLGIENNCFGDIVIDNNKYYFFILSRLENYVKNNLTKIGKYNVTLNKIDSSYLENYQKKYEVYNIIVSSLRLDAVVSEVVKLSRKEINYLIQNKEITVNYEITTKKTYILKKEDIFSVHKYGKFKFIEVKKTTKKDKLIIEYIKYI